MAIYDDFIKALNDKKIVNVKVNTYEKGIVDRLCVPFDFGPGKKFKDGRARYHFLDLDSPDGPHNLSVLPEQVIVLEITGREFDPAQYVKWTPNWIIPRNWGQYS